LESTPRGLKSTPRGLESTPRGLKSTPRGLKLKTGVLKLKTGVVKLKTGVVKFAVNTEKPAKSVFQQCFTANKAQFNEKLVMSNGKIFVVSRRLSPILLSSTSGLRPLASIFSLKRLIACTA
jgi:hypothetical protein